MALETEATDVSLVNRSIDYSGGLVDQVFPYPCNLNVLTSYWREGDPVNFVEDIKDRIDRVFYDEEYKVLAFNIFRQFALGEAISSDKSDPMHLQY